MSLYSKLKSDSANWANEEEVRKSWLKHIENELDITFHAERGRNDASYNQVIIEFKDKGLFKGSTKSAAFKEAIYDRLAKYIVKRAKQEGIAPEEYIGIATDGDHICFAFHKGGNIYPRNLLPFSETTIALVTQACLDSRRRAVTADNLIEDFGHATPIGKNMMAGLAKELVAHVNDSANNKIKMLFAEWRALFGQVADLSAAQKSEIGQQIPLAIALPKADKTAALLFVIHTYNAFLMKLLAAELIAEHGLTAHSDFCEHLLGYGDAVLIKKLDVELERGAFFEAARIKGFIEEAVFSWYADSSVSDAGQQAICEGIRGLLRQLALYRLDDLSAARSKDVLKAFYQSLVPETLRKALGEFYTPDWLVDVTCDRARIENWLDARVLDPTCGSGSFLLEAIRRKRLQGQREGITSTDLLKNILSNVWGFDLNPLAVQSARVNFLIAVADLIAAAKIEVELPILLADAVYSPAPEPNKGKDTVEYRIGSAQSDLKIVLPPALALDRKRLDAVFEAMSEAVESEFDYKDVEKSLKKRAIISAPEADLWKEALSISYGQVLNLHRKAWNGIWFRIVRNFFWSAVAGRFDLVVGNPPWVRWSNLPEIYRERIKPTCEQYEIFSETPYHGGNELDISGMITYTVGDKWLKSHGSLVFLITQTHFQSPSSQGFRSFKINSKQNLVPLDVDDLKKLKPFAKVANKTAIMHLQKVQSARKPTYPIPYRVWEKAKDFGAAIPENLSKAEVLKRVKIKSWEATPVSGGNSPWAILPKGRFQAMSTIQGESDWVQGRKGVTTDLNGVFMVSILDKNKAQNLVQIETRPHAGKTDIGPARRFWIEPTLLYPLLKGAGDFSACHVHLEEDLFILIPNAGITRSDYEQAEDAITELPSTRNYFRAFRSELEDRSTYRKRQKGAPYYAVYNSGAYTFAPYKVVWAELSTTFEAAVVTQKSVPLVGVRCFVPDHKVYFAEFDDAAMAYYVCGLLNSAIVKEYVQSHTIQIQVSNVFKHLKLPEFNAKDSRHRRIWKLCSRAHSANSRKQREELLRKLSTATEKLLAGGGNAASS